jgi:poly(A) polymerase
LFVAGESRPRKPAKDKKKKDGNKSAKRQFTETGLDVRDTRNIKSPRRSLAAQE